MKIKERIKLERLYWRTDLAENKNKIIVSFILLIAAVYLDYLSGNYTSRIQGYHVQDIILDHAGPINLKPLFVWGYIIVLSVFFFYPVLFKPKKMHRAIVMFSLLIFVRSVFLCLTHLVTPQDAITADFPWIFSNFRFKNDLFFSAHTAVPFLGFLIFKDKAVKYFMLISSVILGATVLLMHQHYSIDVFSAFFITYGVYKIGEKIFKERSI
jgi:hypothetical protein